MQKLKKGDEIFLEKSVTNQAFSGKTCIIKDIYPNYVDIVSKDGTPNTGSFNLYGWKDTFYPVDREQRAIFFREERNRLLTEAERLGKEIEGLEQFKSEEDYVADKLDKILRAKGPKQISKILKQLKVSNYL